MAIMGHGVGQCTEYVGIGISAGKLILVIGYPPVLEGIRKCLARRQRPYDGFGEVEGILYHKLYHREYLPWYIFGDNVFLGAEAKAIKYEGITFAAYYGKDTGVHAFRAPVL